MAFQGESRIESKDLLVVNKVLPVAAGEGQKYGKEGYVLRIVAWIFEKSKGGIGQSVSLEKRALFMGDDGEVKNGKAKGFGIDDLAMIQARWKEIVETMKNAPAPSWPTNTVSAKPAALVEDLEEVAF